MASAFVGQGVRVLHVRTFALALRRTWCDAALRLGVDDELIVFVARTYDRYEKTKSVSEKREDELRKMRERIKVHQQVAERRRRALSKVSVIARLKSGFGAAAAAARAKAAVAKVVLGSSDRSSSINSSGHSNDHSNGGKPGLDPVDAKASDATLAARLRQSKVEPQFASGIVNGMPAWFGRARRAVRIESLAPGDGVCKPTQGDTVIFHYRATVARDGTEIDNTYVRSSARSSVPLCVLVGWLADALCCAPNRRFCRFVFGCTSAHPVTACPPTHVPR